MPLLKSSTAPTFEHPALSRARPRRPQPGARETCVWRISLAPGTPGTPHALDREEILVALTGQAQVELDGQTDSLAPGDTVIVPAGQSFSLSNPGAEPFTALDGVPGRRAGDAARW